jgi:hypothetical protein
VAGATHDKALPVGRHPLQLYSLATPNGVKVTVLFEELLESGHDAESAAAGSPGSVADAAAVAAHFTTDAEYVDDDEDAEDEQPVVCEEPDEEEEEEPEEDEGSLMIKKMREEQVRMAEEKRTKMRNRHLP